MRTIRPILAVLCGVLLANGGLASQSIQIQAKESLFGKAAAHSDFAQESLKTFTVFTLSNGIPVIIKRNTANRVQHLSLVLAGGSLLQSTADAGTEALALAVMARSSASYDYAHIQNLLDETSSSIGQAAGFDSSSYSLNTLDTYFDRLLPIWADTLVNPVFSEKDFSQVLSDSRIALQSKEQDPWAKTSQVMNADFFKGHPYGAPPEGTKESLGAASLAGVRAWYGAAFSANRIFLVAVGNFDVPKLKKSLEATIGTIPDRRVPLPKSIPPIRTSGTGKLLKQDYPQSKGVGYLRGDFPAPGPEDDDYMALNVGMKMLSDLLFNVVRDKYGAVYSPGASIRAFNANYGTLSIFKTKVASVVKAYIDEAVASLAAGYCLSVDPTLSGGADAEEPRMTIEQALPVYKALFLNAYYEKQQTNAAVAAQIASSVIRSSDFRSYLLDSEKVQAVTAEGIRAALKKYLLEGTISWVALGSKDVIDPIDQADFTVPFSARPELAKTKK